MGAFELLARSAMAYGSTESYLDQGTITVDQPSGRSEYAFQTLSIRDGDFYFQLTGGSGARLRDYQVSRAGLRFETVRSGTYGQAATLEAAIRPLLDLTTHYTMSVPRILAGDSWGASQELTDVRIVGTTSVVGQQAIILEIDLIEGGQASLWLDQATLLIRRMTHESPRNQAVVTVAFTRLEAR